MADTLVIFLKVFFKQRFILNKKSAGDDKSIKISTLVQLSKLEDVQVDWGLCCQYIKRYT